MYDISATAQLLLQLPTGQEDKIVEFCRTIESSVYRNESAIFKENYEQKQISTYAQRTFNLTGALFPSSAHPVIVALLLCPNKILDTIFMHASMPEVVRRILRKGDMQHPVNETLFRMLLDSMRTDKHVEQERIDEKDIKRQLQNSIEFHIWLQRSVHALRSLNPFDQRNMFYLNRYFGPKRYITDDRDIMVKLLHLVGAKLTPFPSDSPLIDVKLPLLYVSPQKARRKSPLDKYFYRLDSSDRTLVYPLFPPNLWYHDDTGIPIKSHSIVISVERTLPKELVGWSETIKPISFLMDTGTMQRQVIETTAAFPFINQTRIDVFGPGGYLEKFRSQRHSLILRSRQDVSDRSMHPAHIHGAFAVHRSTDPRTGKHCRIKPYRLHAVVCVRQHDEIAQRANGSVAYLLEYDDSTEPDGNAMYYRSHMRKIRFYRYDPILMIRKKRASVLQYCGTDIRAPVAKFYAGKTHMSLLNGKKKLTIRQEIEQRGTIYIYMR